ncbi:hypothetical protein ASPVEDRAFT_622321 [Aspergillus versicolor CBS 583.65]|uniref:Uncharacterized protein n=1 Tax=Aspergillus versicolor CBS 583.65 TaxID=1036611 RepID=A0A1L9PIE5_ASPVE|nr:uncharacterized protein ASPVEDRAFT_622321 [Aspergillus versicolor CBS 583.65]OJJ01205.1 hypothetical protein ASPVEDRAFT_622321 [Aspergillus versicolor CBS 583.65]
MVGSFAAYLTWPVHTFISYHIVSWQVEPAATTKFPELRLPPAGKARNDQTRKGRFPQFGVLRPHYRLVSHPVGLMDHGIPLFLPSGQKRVCTSQDHQLILDPSSLLEFDYHRPLVGICKLPCRISFLALLATCVASSRELPLWDIVVFTLESAKGWLNSQTSRASPWAYLLPLASFPPLQLAQCGGPITAGQLHQRSRWPAHGIFDGRSPSRRCPLAGAV